MSLGAPASLWFILDGELSRELTFSRSAHSEVQFTFCRSQVFLSPYTMAVHVVMIRSASAFHLPDRLVDVLVNFLKIVPVAYSLRRKRTCPECQSQSQDRKKLLHAVPLPLNSVPGPSSRKLERRYPRCICRQTLLQYMTGWVELPTIVPAYLCVPSKPASIGNSHFSITWIRAFVATAVVQSSLHKNGQRPAVAARRCQPEAT